MMDNYINKMVMGEKMIKKSLQKICNETYKNRVGALVWKLQLYH